MSRFRYRVDLRGSWERPKTTGDEVNPEMHRIIRDAAAREDFEADFRTYRKPVLDGETPVRVGTFTVRDLPVRADSRHRARKRARDYVRAFTEDMTCRAPRLHFDDNSIRVRIER